MRPDIYNGNGVVQAGRDLSMFDPETSLINLRPVQWCFWIAVGLSVLLALIIAAKESSTPFDFSGAGFNQLIELYKVPLGILATGLAIIGIFGANHRSEQTKRQIQRTSHQIDLTTRQIDLSRDQNNFSNYFKHIEEFEKYHKTFDGIMVSVSSKRGVHSRVFSNARIGDFHAAKEILDFFEASLREIFFEFDELSRSDATLCGVHFRKIINLRDGLSTAFSAYTTRRNGSNIPTSEDPVLLPEGTIIGLFLSVKEVVEVVDAILKFDSHYVSTETYKALTNIPLAIFPDGNGFYRYNFPSLPTTQEAN